MALTIDLPSLLDDELTRDAEREGVSPAEHAAILLALTTALRRDRPPTPFREAVRVFLAHRSLDVGKVADALDELIGVCAAIHDSGKGSQAFQDHVADWPRDHDADDVTALLRRWRNWAVHRPDPSRRLSAMGKYAHIPGSSEDFAREKRREIDREDGRGE